MSLRKEAMAGGKESRSFDRRTLLSEIRYVSNSPELSARISDISVGGLFIDTVNPLDLGAEVKFKLLLPGAGSEREIVGEGKVTWRSSKRHVSFSKGLPVCTGTDNTRFIIIFPINN